MYALKGRFWIRNRGILKYSSNVKTEKHLPFNEDKYVKTLKVTPPTSSRPTGLKAFLIRIFTVFSPKKISTKDVWSAYAREQWFLADIRGQRFQEKQFKRLGAELAAAYFVLERGGLVQFQGKPWMKFSEAVKNGMPNVNDRRWVIEGIDVSGMELHCEGYENFRFLSALQVFRTKNNPQLDDWSLDYMCAEMPFIKELDLSGCKKVTAKGLRAIARLRNLQTIKLNDIPASETPEFKFTCILLEDILPALDIQGVNFDSKSSEERKSGELPINTQEELEEKVLKQEVKTS